MVVSFPGIPARLGLAVLYLYRLIVSPIIVMLFGRACRFEPSCSQYAEQAIRTHGILRGGMMAAHRLLRCHPLGGQGYDPVPARAGAGRE